MMRVWTSKATTLTIVTPSSRWRWSWLRIEAAARACVDGLVAMYWYLRLWWDGE